MSQSAPTPLEEMSRDELMDEVKDLRSEVDDLCDEFQTVREDTAHLSNEVNRLRSENEELRSEIERLENKVENGLKARKIKFDNLQTAVLGGPNKLTDIDPDEFRDLWTRTTEAEDTLEDHEQRLAMVRTETPNDGGPDDRAEALRQTLYNKAKNNGGTSAIDRHEAESALGGGLHKGSVLDAMKRAADGRDADIGGTSGLSPVDFIDFQTGGGRGNPSRIVMDVTKTPAPKIRQNLTTENTAGGGK